MTTYGTISVEDPEASSSSNKLYLSRTKQLLHTIVGTTRPWQDLIPPSHSHFTFPFSFLDAVQRIKTNARVFRANYVIMVLLVLNLCLLWHPIAVIMFSLLMAAWVVLYFLRENPLRMFGYEVDERLVAMLLSLMTVWMVFMSSVTENMIVGVCVGVAIVLIHGFMRETEEDDEEVSFASDGRQVVKVPLRQTASSSFTM